MSAKFRMSLDVRWGDMDAFDHINSGAYLKYLEEIRVRWMDSVPSHWQEGDTGPVVANISINYRQAIHWPAEIEITLKPLSPGRSSVKLEHEIREKSDTPDGGALYADATVTIVWIDKAKGESVPLPNCIRELAASD
ncbi:MAG: thioesterase family protein [Pseudomonadota bacterium]